MFNFLARYSLTILPTVIDVGLVIKNLVVRPKPQMPKPAFPVIRNKGSAMNLDKASLFMTMIACIPPDFYKNLTTILLEIFKVIFKYTFKLIKYFGIFSYLFFAVSLGYAVYWLKFHTITIPALKETINMYFPEMPAEFINEISYVVIIIVFIFILGFFYTIMFKQKPKEKLTYIKDFHQNGYGKLIVSQLPEENTAWGKAFIIVFYLGCTSILGYLALFFRYTLPAIVQTYGAFKSSVVEIQRSFTLEEKTEWIKDVKILLVDSDVPTRIITPILRDLLKNIANVNSQEELLAVATIKVQQAYTKLNEELKLSFWKDVVLQHPFMFIGLFIGVAVTVGILLYCYKDDLANQRATHNAMISLQRKMYNEITTRMDYIVATQYIHQEAIKKGAAFTAAHFNSYQKFYDEIQKMLKGDFWDKIQADMNNILKVAPQYHDAVNLVHTAAFNLSQLRNKINDYPNPALIDACKGLHFERASEIKNGGLVDSLFNAMQEVVTLVPKALRKLNYERVIENYHKQMLADQAANRPTTGLAAFMRDTFNV